jgi:hypothetical protein
VIEDLGGFVCLSAGELEGRNFFREFSFGEELFWKGEGVKAQKESDEEAGFSIGDFSHFKAEEKFNWRVIWDILEFEGELED